MCSELLDGQLAGHDLRKGLAVVAVAEQAEGSGNPLHGKEKPAIHAVGISSSKGGAVGHRLCGACQIRHGDGFGAGKAVTWHD
jgi:hypothetical protein